MNPPSQTSTAILNQLIDATRQRLPALRATHRQLPHESHQTLDFRAFLQPPGCHIIAEVKLASPSRGRIAGELDEVDVARAYVQNGASAISFLTEPVFFQGDIDQFRRARAACPDVPFLMKDIFVDPVQIDLASAVGADCVLLIAAALSPEALESLMSVARRRGLSVLLEVHTEDEMGLAIDLRADLIGINNRNLRTLNVDLGTWRRLAPMARGRDITLVSESGVRSHADMQKLMEQGCHAFLVGTHFMVSANPGRALRDLLRGGGTTHE